MLNRLTLASEAAILLFFSGAAVGAFNIWREGASSPEAWLLVASLPAAAGLLLMLVTIFVPGMLAVGKLRFPLNITLPLVHVAFAIAIARLIAATYNSIEKIPTYAALVLRWVEPKYFLAAMAVQVLLLTAITLRTPKMTTGKPQGS